MREPALKKSLYWCPSCNLPLVGGRCGCGTEGFEIPLLKPYDVRPALAHDMDIMRGLLKERFGFDEIPQIILFNKTGGLDRNDLVVANGVRFGWLSFDPLNRKYRFEPSFESLPFIIDSVKSGIVDISGYVRDTGRSRLGGKKIEVDSSCGDGPVIIRAGNKYGVGILSGRSLKIKRLGGVEALSVPDPSWDDAVYANKKHLKNLERHAIRLIKSETSRLKKNHAAVNVSFSGGKDSTVVLELARRAGIEDAYYVDTGMEFPQTVEFVKECGIGKILHGEDFDKGLSKYGIPRKDDRWCCERLKLMPVSRWLDDEKSEGFVTIQGNRWYESFARSTLPAVIENPYNKKQINISPIRNWRALEVFLYIWLRELPCNPLYDMGFERVGCWMCPAMLESEAEIARTLVGDKYEKWSRCLLEWAKRSGYSDKYIQCGFWRWKEHPPKMRELAAELGIRI